jgi:alkanesulfonate monooxygenase SsuD/methylene tetrahydromethanopterin reductase-like flavin-dependent oxidoreductase (luciferase family)
MRRGVEAPRRAAAATPRSEDHELDDIGFAPKPVQKPHPPIWVGGDSPGAFRRVATLGDGWPATSKTPQEMEKSLGALRATADAAGRSMSSIELSVLDFLRDTLAEMPAGAGHGGDGDQAGRRSELSARAGRPTRPCHVPGKDFPSQVLLRPVRGGAAPQPSDFTQLLTW